MTQENWNRLSFLEQLSNIDGEVTRLVDARERYLSGEAAEDRGEDYLGLIRKLINMTFFDPKNREIGYRAVEIMDEFEEIRRFLRGEVDGDYITSYWHQFTNAIS